jgi:subtilase family serine protease
VVAAGGTSVSRNPSTGVFEAEQTWQQTGGGISAYLARPSYQSSVSAIVGTHRGVPDIAAVADPDTGVWVYSQYGASQCDNSIWCVVGGTSVASPVSAGILSWKAVHTTSIQQVLNTIYTASGSGFRDVTSGNCGPYAGWLAGAGWDLCTGRGSIAAASTTLVISGVAP